MNALDGSPIPVASRQSVACTCALASAMLVGSCALAAGKAVPEVGGSDSQPDDTPAITLRLYDYVNLSQAVVSWSEATTTEIFKRAGVRVAWVECPVSTRQLRKSPACRGEMGTTDFAVRLLTQPMAANLVAINHPMGLAQECPDDERGCVANILYPRVGELASQVPG